MSNISSPTPDATTTSKGKLQLANFLGGTAATPTIGIWDGWIASPYTWVYASATSFTVAGVNLTSVFTPGTRISYNDGAVDYGTVASSSFSSDTTVLLVGNGDYSIANVALTAPRYSNVSNPQGYPGVFTWTTTLTGWSSNPTNTVYRLAMWNNLVWLHARQVTAGTSSAAAHSGTVPENAPARTLTNMGWLGMGQTTDNNTVQYGFLAISSAGTTINFCGQGTTSQNTSSGVSRFTHCPLLYEVTP